MLVGVESVLSNVTLVDKRVGEDSGPAVAGGDKEG